MDWNAFGAALAALILGAGSVVLWWQRREATAAKLSAEVAKEGAVRTVADAEHTLYKLLAERQTQLESEIKAMRQELAAERAHSRQLEVHLFRLENIMRKAGLEPPEREFLVG